jgi:hypothetical protein
MKLIRTALNEELSESRINVANKYITPELRKDLSSDIKLVRNLLFTNGFTDAEILEYMQREFLKVFKTA